MASVNKQQFIVTDTHIISNAQIDNPLMANVVKEIAEKQKQFTRLKTTVDQMTEEQIDITN